MKKTILLMTTILFNGIAFSQTATTTVDTTTTVMSNTSLLFGITFESRTGMNDNFGNPIGYYNTTGIMVPEIDTIFNDFPMSTLRYPANGIAKGFNWKKSVGLPASSRPNQNLLGSMGPPQPVTFGFDEFMAMTASKGVLPQDVQIMVPIYDSATVGLTSPQQNAALPNVIRLVADWVEYTNAPNDGSNTNGGIDWALVRATNGHPLPYGIKIWNMGNEPWTALEFGSSMSGCTNYLNSITPLIDSMLAIDPTIKITLATIGPENSNWNTIIKNSSLVAQGKIYGISPHYFPGEPLIGVANVEAELTVLADTAQIHGLKIILGDYAPRVFNTLSLASQDSAMQWGGANLCADFLLLMSQIPNVERVNFWEYGLPPAQWHPIRKNSLGNYTLMPVAVLYKKLFPLVLDKSLSVINTSPVASDGNPYSVRSGAFASNDLSQLNVISVNRDKNVSHTLGVNGISGYNLTNARLLTATNLATDTIIEITVSADINGNFSMPPMSVLILEYANTTTGINETVFSSAVNIFPNPFYTQTVLQADNILQNATLTVYNSFGQTVKQIKNISGQTVTLYRDNLTSGLYFIHLTQDNRQIITKKIIITD